MNKILSVKLFVKPNCELIAVDTSDYDQLENELPQYVMLEFLSYNEEDSHLPKSVRLKKEINNREYYSDEFSSHFNLDIDGTYYYYKLVIPTLDSFKISNDNYENLYNELFFYKDDIYISEVQSSEICSLSEVLSQSRKITNYLEAYQLIQNEYGSRTFYCPKEIVFSVCKLQRCLVSLQEKLLFSGSCACSYNKCNTDNELRDRRDFLLSALYVFDYLNNIKNFSEAQRILDNLSSCNSICGDELGDNNVNNCGCGSII